MSSGIAERQGWFSTKAIRPRIFTASDLAATQLRVHRALLLAGGSLFPLMGVAYRIQNPGMDVNMSFRVIFALVCFGFFFWSYKSEWLREKLWTVIYFLSTFASLSVVYLMFKSNLSPMFLLGLVVMMFSVSIVFRTPLHLAAYFFAIIFLSTVVCFSLPDPQIQPIVPVVCLIIVSVMGYIVLSARLVLIQKLLQSSDLAISSAKAKGEFLANMSHEIRTPMNGVLGMLDLLIDTDLATDQVELAVTAQQSAESLLVIINDILDFSKIEAGKLELSPVPFKLSEFLYALEMLHAVRLRDKDIQFYALVDKDVPKFIHGDPVRLRQIMVNLIGNAIKFTPKGGEISIGISKIGDTEKGAVLRFAISDTGIGIPPEKQAEVFEAFSQADASITREFGGTGLGLSISNTLVGLMSGEMSVESEEGVGSTFSFTADLGVASEKDLDAIRNRANTWESLKTSNPLKVLVAEDNLVNQKVTTSMLKKFGHDVLVAANGEEAVELFESDQFDVILMDIHMPVMGGEEAAANIRSLKNGRDVPIVALTANAMVGDRERYLAVGMDDYVTKPIKKEALFEVLESLKPQST